MNRRYILLSSSNRNRKDFPNPFDFVTSSQSNTNKSHASDGISNNSPIIQYDMGDYFSGFSTHPGTEYRWEQTGTVDEVYTISPSRKFVVSIDARLNAGAPAPITGQYVGLAFINDTSSEQSVITEFTYIGFDLFEITLEDRITVAATDTFTIATEYLALNQSYIPIPVDSLDLKNAYTGLQLSTLDTETSRTITEVSDRIITVNDDFPTTTQYPHQFFISESARFLKYEVQAVTAKTITLIANSVFKSENLVFNYIYHYPSGTIARITEVSEVDAITDEFTITLDTQTDLSGSISVSDDIFILLFSGMNNVELNYSPPQIETQWQNKGQVRIYDLELMWLSIPNKVFLNEPGGYSVNYPYFFVDIENLSSNERTEQVIFSNNPHVSKAVFVVPVQDISTPEFASFTKFDGGCMVYPYNIKSRDILRFTIRTPDGKVLEMTELDTSSPLRPDPTLQVSAMLAVTSRPTTNTPCNPLDPNKSFRPMYM